MATYNCTDSTNSAYGDGDFGTCADTSQSVGAPNTGLFQQVIDSGSFTIIAPLIVSIVVVVISSVIIKHRKRTQ